MKKLLIVMYVACLGVWSEATLFEFTAEEGFFDGGGVNWQADWTGNPANVVDTDGTGSVVLSSSGWALNRCNQAITDDTLTLTSTFFFTQVSGTPAKMGVFGVDISNTEGTTSPYLSAGLRRIGLHWYDLKILGSGGNSSGDDTEGFHESAIGINEGSGDMTSDMLRLTTTVVRGTTESDWSMTIILSNLTTGVELERMTDDTITVVSAFHNAASLYGGINSLNSDADTLTLNRFVESFEIIDSGAELTGYEAWVSEYELSNAEPDADPDSDGYSNLREYALGGHPGDISDTGHKPVFFIQETTGTNWFCFVHVQRSDPDSGLVYVVETTTNLVAGAWGGGGIEILDEGIYDADFDVVTNGLPMQNGCAFVGLGIAQE